jgi:23S rRNA (guanosine2251-2'-O)-methyltransferase
VSGIGGEQVEGRRAVRELLVAGTRRVRSVWVARNARAEPLLDEIVDLAGGRARIVDPQRLDAAARTDAPQGVVARADPLPEAILDDLLAAPDCFLAVLDGVTDPRNLGAVARGAETAGCTGLVIARRRSAHVTPAAAKAAAGAIEHLPIALVSGIPSALQRARRAGVWTVGLDEHGEQSVFDLDLGGQRLAVVFGAEGRGLARLTRERCEVVVRIPVRGHIESLNVAAAAAVALHVLARGRPA